MDAIITAGGISTPDDPLYAVTGVAKKALIPLAGKPMVQWVVEALFGSGLIDHMVVVGLSPEEIDFGDLPVVLIDGVDGMIDNILAALDRLKAINPHVQKIFLSSSDIPLVTPEIIRGFVQECGDLSGDVYYAIIEEKTMEAQFPDSRRTFVPFKGGRYCGGDVFITDVSVPDKTDLDLFRNLTAVRKNYWQEARLLGAGFIIRFLLRMMTVQEAAARARKRLNLDAHIVDTQYAALGMDLDKPRQYEMIRDILEQRQSAQV